MAGLFDGTPFERPITCERCAKPLDQCRCPRSADGAICLPSGQRVRVSRERRGGGKWVTVITGLDPEANDLGAMLKSLKTLCAAGGSIQDDALELQGDHRERVLAHLLRLGYAAKLSGG